MRQCGPSLTTVAFNLSVLLTQAPLAIAQSLLPAFSQLQAHPERTGLQQLYHRALQGSLFWVVPAAAPLCRRAALFHSLGGSRIRARKYLAALYPRRRTCFRSHGFCSLHLAQRRRTFGFDRSLPFDSDDSLSGGVGNSD